MKICKFLKIPDDLDSVFNTGYNPYRIGRLLGSEKPKSTSARDIINFRFKQSKLNIPLPEDIQLRLCKRIKKTGE